MKRTVNLNIALIMVGLAIMYLGLNIGLGGMQTLGWQTSEKFFTVTNETVFQVQDSHIRFIGGIWFSVGAIFFLGAIRLDKLRTTLIVLCAAIAFSGLFRLSSLVGGGILSGATIPSFELELIAFPMLALWLVQSGKQAM